MVNIMSVIRSFDSPGISKTEISSAFSSLKRNMKKDNEKKNYNPDKYLFKGQKKIFDCVMNKLKSKEPSRPTVCLAARRYGKSSLSRLLLMEAALMGFPAMYIGVTSSSSVRNIWQGLTTMSKVFDGYIKEQTKTIEFRDTEGFLEKNFNYTSDAAKGFGVIRLFGNSSVDDMNTWRGLHNGLIIMDEMQSQSDNAHIKDAIYGVLMPTLIDLKGTIFFMGTQPLSPSGFWYEYTENTSKYDFFEGNTFDNHHNGSKKQIEAQIKIQAESMDVDYRTDPVILREYYNKRVFGKDSAVYSFPESLNLNEEGELLGIDKPYLFSKDTISKREETSFNQKTYSTEVTTSFMVEGNEIIQMVIGYDVGFRDADAFVLIGVVAPNKKCEKYQYYILEEVIKKELNPSQKVVEVQNLLIKWRHSKPIQVVYDSQGGGINVGAELINQVPGINLHAAFKGQKMTGISTLVNIVADGRLRVQEDSFFYKDSKKVFWTKDSNGMRIIDEKNFHSDVIPAVRYAIVSMNYENIKNVSGL